MLNAAHGLVPVLTSQAGSCLTPENWREVNISMVSYHLDSLLLKPGQAVLKQTADLKRYLGWTGSLVINAMSLLANKEGVFTLVSPYDGSKLKCTYSELAAIIRHLKPDALVLPKKFILDYPDVWTNWPESTVPIIPAVDLSLQDLQRPHGVFFQSDAFNNTNHLMEQLKKWNHIPRYVMGDVGMELMRSLRENGVEYIESDAPAKAGMDGKVYTKDGELDLQDSAYELHFETIEPNCSCPTCAQKLSKAYLHHLILHTPLLAQRFLIQHNVYHIQNPRHDLL